MAFAADPAYRVLAGDKGKVAIVDATGKVQWEYANKAETHDLHLLPNGNVLLTLPKSTVGEVDKDGKIVWQFECKPKEGSKDRVEIHAFQRLEDGLTMIAESGNRRIIEVDKDGKIVREVPLTVEKPSSHRDTRMENCAGPGVRKHRRYETFRARARLRLAYCRYSCASGIT